MGAEAAGVAITATATWVPPIHPDRLAMAGALAGSVVVAKATTATRSVSSPAPAAEVVLDMATAVSEIAPVTAGMPIASEKKNGTPEGDSSARVRG